MAPDAKIEPSHLQAVHRLKKPANVIIKFISRKQKHDCIIKRGRLADEKLKEAHDIDNNIYLNESMCFEVKHLFYLCKQLKIRKKIDYYCFFNGNLKIKKEQNSDFTIIEHISDLAVLLDMEREEIEVLGDNNHTE